MSATRRRRLRDVVLTTANFALLTSCATSAAMAGEAGECGAADAARTLEMARLDPATMDRRVRWSAAAGAGTIENSGGAVFEGRCAGAIRTFSVNSVFLIDGGRLEVTPTGLEPSDWPNAPAEPIGPGDPHPRARGVFVMADRIGYRGGPAEPLAYFIGLWRDGSGSVLRAWSERAGGGFTAPRDILRIDVDGRSLTYFPAVDTPSGGVYVTYRIDRQRTGLILFNWSHPKIFD